MSRRRCDGKAFHTRQQKSFYCRSCCMCIEQHIFSQTQNKAEGGQYWQWAEIAECRKLWWCLSNERVVNLASELELGLCIRTVWASTGDQRLSQRTAFIWDSAFIISFTVQMICPLRNLLWLKHTSSWRQGYWIVQTISSSSLIFFQALSLSSKCRSLW